MRRVHPIHDRARVAEIPGDDGHVLVVQRLLDGEWEDVDEVQLAPGVDVDINARHLAGAYRKVVAAAPGSAAYLRGLGFADHDDSCPGGIPGLTSFG